MIKKHTQSYLAIREERFAALSADYRKIITEAVAHFGSTFELSRRLGRQERYIANALSGSGTGAGIKSLRAIANKIGDIL